MLNAQVNYFDQLKPYFEKRVELYKDDFLIIDKEHLNNYQGRFIWFARQAGTNLIKFDMNFDKQENEVDRDLQNWIFKHWIEHNKVFIVGNKGKIRKVSKAKVIEYFNRFYKPTTAFFG